MAERPQETMPVVEEDGPGLRADPSGSDARLKAEVAAWRAAAAATADPRWARPGPGGLPPPYGAGPAYDAYPPEADARAGEAARTAETGQPGQGQGQGAPSSPRRWPVRLLPAVLAAAGAVLIVFSSTMTWATVRAFGLIEYSVAGTDPDQHGRLTVGLGLVVGVSALALLVRPGGAAARLVCSVAGLAGLAAALVALLDIGYLRGGGLVAGSGVPATTRIGPGLWLLLLGGVLGLAAALVARSGRRGPDHGRARRGRASTGRR